jgi:hypothetical protein
MADGAAVFLSTLSHPGSAPGNVAHAVNIKDGAVRFAVQLGGSQGFWNASPIKTRAGMHLPGLITVDPRTGAEQWRTVLTGRLAASLNRIVALEADRLVTLDASTGRELSGRRLPPDLQGAALFAALDHRTLLVASPLRVLAIDSVRLTSQWSTAWPAPLAAYPLVTHDLVVAVLQRGRVVAYDTPSAAE